MAKEYLKPCPFCGGQASSSGKVTYSKNHEVWFSDGSRVVEAFFVCCLMCGITNKGMVGHQTKEIAVDAWNTRA